MVDRNALDKIRNYSEGFTFTVNFNSIPDRIRSHMYDTLREAEKQGLIESVGIGLGWFDNGDFGNTDTKYIRKGE